MIILHLIQNMYTICIIVYIKYDDDDDDYYRQYYSNKTINSEVLSDIQLISHDWT